MSLGTFQRIASSTNLSCTVAVSSPLWFPLLFGSRTRTKLSGNIPVRPLAFNVPCHQPPGICLMRCIMAPLCRSSSSGSFAAYSYSTIAQIAAKRERERQREKWERESKVRETWLVSQWGNLIWDTRIYNDTQCPSANIYNYPAPRPHQLRNPLLSSPLARCVYQSLQFATWHSHFVSFFFFSFLNA